MPPMRQFFGRYKFRPFQHRGRSAYLAHLVPPAQNGMFPDATNSGAVASSVRPCHLLLVLRVSRRTAISARHRPDSPASRSSSCNRRTTSLSDRREMQTGQVQGNANGTGPITASQWRTDPAGANPSAAGSSQLAAIRAPQDVLDIRGLARCFRPLPASNEYLRISD